MDQTCRTKYPVLLIHGVGFRDLKLPVYWGRIPKTLTSRGASIYYGLQDCWADTAENAKPLKYRIEAVLDETGAEKVNIVAHSKGGLEARMAASSLGMGGSIASITTIGTPHHGSKTIDQLLKAPDSMFNIASFAVNNWIGLIGDTKPDFYRVCREFSTQSARDFNAANPDVPGVFYQSFGGVMKGPFSDINLSTANAIVSFFEGPNDGLVSVRSAKWGEKFTLLRGNSKRGVSHYDEIDFRRRALTKTGGGKVSDICEVYADILSDLRARGY